MDIRLYNKARTAIEPFAFEKYRKEKIRQQIEANRPNRLKIKSNLPAVNQELALKFMEAEENRTMKKGATNLLQDDRFKALFENPEFQVDKNAVEYKMLTPVLSRLDKSKVKELKRKAQQAAFAQADEEEAKSSGDEDLFDVDNNEEDEEELSSDDDDRTWTKEVKKQYRQIRKDQKRQDRNEDESSDDDNDADGKLPATKMIEVPNAEFKVKNLRSKINK